MTKQYILAFSVLLACSTHLLAQTPGGVDGVELWFRSEPVGTDLQGTYRWKDISGDSTALRLQSGSEFTQERSAMHAINFHPAPNLSAGVTAKFALLKRSNLSQATIFGVFSPDISSHATDMVLYGIDGRSGAGSLLTKDKAVRATGTDALDYGSETGEDLLYQSSDSLDEEGFKESAIRVMTYMKADRPSTSVWGESTQATITAGTTYSQISSTANTTFDTSQFGDNKFSGYTPELIVYGRWLTPGERRRVESGLAVRYGITLKSSYLDSEGNLVWNMDENSTHHHRVTAIANDKQGSLSQPMSTTSYEEAPTYSALKDNDSFHGSNSYALPSVSHLLVMGSEYGNGMPDGKYIFWGDDDAPVSTYTSDTDSLWHIMNRTWLVKANTTSVADSTAVKWTSDGLSVSQDGFLDNLTQETAASDAYALTPSLTNGEGAIEFDCPAAFPSFDVGFSHAGGTSCAYGFRIATDGSVYSIKGGEVSETSIATDVSGKTLSIRKEDGKVYLRIDGTGSDGCTVAIPQTDNSKAYVGIVRTVSAEYPLSLSGIRLGGVGDTGCQAELAYGLTSDGEFSDYSRKRTVMLIDPTGEGTFDSDGLIKIQCSSPDMERGKTMFHNIFWDADGSGSDMFTFAYYDGLSIEATPTPSTCGNGKPNNDGAIDIGINIGTPIYSYTLKVDSVAGKSSGDTVATGTFLGDTHHIDSLAPGSYILEVSQGGGNDIYGKGNALYTSYSHSTEWVTSGDITWTVTGTSSNYRIGMEPRYSDEITQYGFDVRGDKAHIIYKGYTSATQYVTVKEGDVLGLSIGGMQVVYTLNGEVIHKETVWSLRAWRLCVKYGTGETHITNLTLNGEPVPSFETNGSVQVETPKATTATMKVNVGSECDATMPNGVESAKMLTVQPRTTDISETTADETFKVTATDQSSRTYTATLSLSAPDEATLMVFDASGVLVSESQMEGGREKTARFSVPTHGVYIVKAITSNGERTRKIMAR